MARRPETAEAAVKVDVYPVGALAAVQAVWRSYRPSVAAQVGPDQLARMRQWAWHRLVSELSALGYRLRHRRWRDAKNIFNGYLAEPTPFPEGLTRCGSGWTKRRALRSLQRHVRQPGIHWDAVDRAIVEALR
jgi:hypothetical protein